MLTGEIFGEEEFFSVKTREYSVKAVSNECEILRVTKEDLEYVIQDKVTMGKFKELIT